MARITFDDVSLTLEGRQVFGPASLVLDDRRVGVIGQNGAGKSSFLRLMAGLIQPDSGRVLLGNSDVFKDRKAALAGIGVIFQNPDHQILFPTVVEEIAFGLTQLGASKAAAHDRALAVLQVQDRADWADRQCYTLSGGQRHYLCLMAVLAMEPDVILLDEPYAGLDIPTSARLHRQLDSLAQSLVMITHDPALLADYDRVIWIDDGLVKADGVPSEILPPFKAEMERRGAC
ncbi:energy-coupling factor ABC transporter ATP-binding protein [Neptunicoccus cionae]|uniref:Cobalt ABC transporter n=1 Tax=Neptunicoccus cionae TaxID=2035344 RepID=A0A916VNL6_9RHOB|nr:ABC transporter ATP-binding protein [Amylibacter cionae]GGA13173.1 cobalt ABC transporter [Amylibacter cionae]